MLVTPNSHSISLLDQSDWPPYQIPAPNSSESPCQQSCQVHRSLTWDRLPRLLMTHQYPKIDCCYCFAGQKPVLRQDYPQYRHWHKPTLKISDFYKGQMWASATTRHRPHCVFPTTKSESHSWVAAGYFAQPQCMPQSWSPQYSLRCSACSKRSGSP